MIRVVEKGGPTRMVSVRIPDDVVEELAKIANKEHVSKTQLIVGWLRGGIADYKVNGIEKIKAS